MRIRKKTDIERYFVEDCENIRACVKNYCCPHEACVIFRIIEGLGRKWLRKIIGKKKINKRANYQHKR
jgi:hypothetical protein